MKHIFLLIISCLFSVTSDLKAQAIPGKVALENYRHILLAHTEDLAWLDELEIRCLTDMEDACNCNVIFYNIVMRANLYGVINWDEMRSSFHHQFPDVKFTYQMDRRDLLTVLANERLIKLRYHGIIAYGDAHPAIDNNWFEAALDVLDLQTDDRVTVLQDGGYLLGEILSASGLDHPVTVYSKRPKTTEFLFRGAPEVEADFWKLPKYKTASKLTLPEDSDHTKVLLLSVLDHEINRGKSIRQLTKSLYTNDEVILVENIGGCTIDGYTVGVEDPKAFDKLFLKRDFELLEHRIQSGYYIARYRYVPKYGKVNFAWKTERGRKEDNR